MKRMQSKRLPVRLSIRSSHHLTIENIDRSIEGIKKMQKNRIRNALLVAPTLASASILIKGKELVGDAVARGDVEVRLQQISELRAVRGVDYELNYQLKIWRL